MSAKHTPGPWHVDEAEFESTVYVPTNGDHDDQREIATVKILRYVKDRTQEDIANASLIATAPDLYALVVGIDLPCKLNVGEDAPYRDCECSNCQWERKATEVCVKARGG